MKRIYLVVILILISIMAVGKVNAQVPSPSPAAQKNPYWAHSLQDFSDLAKTKSETLNKEFGDGGALNNQWAMTALSIIGCEDCPGPVSSKNSVLANLSNTVLALYNPPISTKEYAIDLGHTLGFLPKSVAAQGIGFSGLSSLLPIWKGFRNIAYAMLSLILIVIGFMVMFRKKIDPKTVVTVQSAIPRVVVALLLITFSYAIVGLMIDLMYFTIILAANLIGGVAKDSLGEGLGFMLHGTQGMSLTAKPPFASFEPATTAEAIHALLNGGIVKTTLFFFGSGLQALNDIFGMITANLNPAATVATTIVPSLLGYLIAGGGKTGIIIAGLTNGPVLLLLIVLIILLFGIVRLIFMLVDAYINIIISLLVAPFQLMMEAVPGTNSFSSWFRNLLSKIVAFPITAILMLVASVLTSQTGSQTIWAPPLLANGNGVSGMAGFIGLGMLLIIPSVVAGVQKALKAEPFIPGGVGAVLGPMGSGIGQLWQLGYQYSFISSSIRHKPDVRSPMQTIREGSQKGLGSITGQGEGH